jgi:hypothetical protein
MRQIFKTEITVLQIRIQDAVLFDPWIWASGRKKIQIQIRDQG